MKMIIALVGLLISFNVLAQDETPTPPESNKGAMVSFGAFLETMSQGNPIEQAATMLYIGGTIDTLRMLKLICPNPGVTDTDIMTESLGVLGEAAALAIADPNNLQENLALPASFYLLAGLRQLYPCKKTTE
jgi:hypothetical protein